MLNCEGIISKDECVSAIRTFKNGKSPGTDGLPANILEWCHWSSDWLVSIYLWS